MELGFNGKRMAIALVISIIAGIFCAWGTSAVMIPGLVITLPLLVTIFYARVLIGVIVGLFGNMRLVQSESFNAILRGALAGLIVSPVISLYGGTEIMMGLGMAYGAIADLIATKLSK